MLVAPERAARGEASSSLRLKYAWRRELVPRFGIDGDFLQSYEGFSFEVWLQCF